jgi:hypothetical protein
MTTGSRSGTPAGRLAAVIERVVDLALRKRGYVANSAS